MAVESGKHAFSTFAFSFIDKRTKAIANGPYSAVGNVSGYRYVSVLTRLGKWGYKLDTETIFWLFCRLTSLFNVN